jgi:hypothetical protein
VCKWDKTIRHSVTLARALLGVGIWEPVLAAAAEDMAQKYVSFEQLSLQLSLSAAIAELEDLEVELVERAKLSQWRPVP